ncbi:MAG: twin-arginine translocase TatA/TatE family subunit, partial [Candidatus Caldarchaeum sp.]|nr:twin-arginine translocase TatA/TatE family subunit [Candidatus Caldarchaeum sp.]MDW8436061.1 twin-arginine translocase TatA/TatE family subunit [Candidatus Caldarchaeum sp.]
MVVSLTEIAIIAAIILIAIYVLPGKLPKLAKSLGEAKREFEKASKREDILSRARDLGIDVTGKTL